MKPFGYSQPTSISETISLLKQSSGTDSNRPRVLAGGTDLLTLMKEELIAPDSLIDIKRLKDLDGEISLQHDVLRIGALATLASIERHPLVRKHATALSQAALLAASPQLRNMATIGGNVLQRPRCWYFRDRDVSCWLKGGDTCPALEGENQLHAIFSECPCHAVHPSDPATALVALDAKVLIRRPFGERSEPVEKFFALPAEERRTENTLESDEIITGLEIPIHESNSSSLYLKAMNRKVWAFALVGVGLGVRFSDHVVSDVRLVLGGVAPIPRLIPEAATALVGRPLDPARFDEIAELALAKATPLRLNGYKRNLAQGLIRQALEETARTLNTDV